jgi:hypothetical protein
MLILRCLYDNFVSTILNGYLLYQYSSLWFSINPDPTSVETLGVLICFEFIVVQSGVFMAVFDKKLLCLFFMLVFALFAYEFNKMLPIHDNKIMIGYFFIVLHRIRFTFYNISKKQYDRLLGFSGLVAINYILAITFCLILLNYLPKLTYTNVFLNENNFYHKGFDLSNKSFLIATGSVYYSLMIFTTIYNSYLESKHDFA